MKRFFIWMVVFSLIFGFALDDSIASKKPKIRITGVPDFGDGGSLKGEVYNVNPDKYKLAVFLDYLGWWNKPYWDAQATEISGGGSFSCNVVTGGYDDEATGYFVALVSKKTKIPSIGGTGIPKNFINKAAATTEIKRNENGWYYISSAEIKVFEKIEGENQPVENAKVKIGSKKKFSDESGWVFFSKLRAKKYLLSVEKDGYKSYKKKIKISPFFKKKINVNLTPKVEPPVTYELYGMNFGPFLDLNPDYGATVPESYIAKVLDAIEGKTKWIRTYGSLSGLEKVPAMAKAEGFKVAAGCWLSGDLDANENEIEGLISLIEEGNVDMAVVGSETLLRGDLTSEQLVGYIERIKATGIKTVTSDSWSSLKDNLSVVEVCDAIMANFYPYWDGIALDVAIKNLHANFQDLKNTVGDKEIIVGETGWPSCGNTIGDAVPDEENAAYYFLNFISWARAESVDYFYFEAMDESWKVVNEGPQGACWGLFSNEDKLKSGMKKVFNGETMEDNWTVNLPTKGKLEVTVVNNSSKALENAQVSVGEKIKNTDADGIVKFLNLEPGEYNVSVSLSGYASNSENATIFAGETTNAVVVLTKETTVEKGSVKAKIKDDSGNLLASASVLLNGVTKISNSSGEALFTDVPIGDYTIEASKSGYESNSKTVSVEKNTVTTINIVITEIIDKGNASITVYDELSKYLSGATVTIDGTEKTTSASGFASFSNLAGGDYSITISKSGYVTYSGAISIEASSTTTMEQTLATEVSGSPAFSNMTYPAYGVSGYLEGTVTGVSPKDYRVTVYIRVGSGWWGPKPTWASPYTTINSDGTFKCDIDTGGYDENANKIVAYVISKDYSPPSASGGTDPDLGGNPVASWSVDR